MSAPSQPSLARSLLPALTILLLIVVQAQHFHNRAYRQDEAWDVHYALQNIRAVGLPEHVAQVLYQLPPPNFLQDIWLHLFGHHERIVRFFSALMTMLTLAMFYRLAADLYGRRFGWLALVLLGTSSLFAFYSHEARPYAALALGAAGFPWALLRFLRQPNRRRGLFLSLVTILPAFMHPYLAYVYIAQVLCLLLFARINLRRQSRQIALVLALGIVIAYRVMLNFGGHSGSISHNINTDWLGLRELYDHLHFRPEALGLFLLAGGSLFALWKCLPRPANRRAPSQSPQVPWSSLMRRPAGWREGWLLLSLLLLLALPLLVNLVVPSVTPRHFLITLPFIVLLACLCLRQLPGYLQLLAALFFCIPFVFQFRSHSSNGAYWEIIDHLERYADPANDHFAVMARELWENIAINYYLQEGSRLGLGESDIFHFSGQELEAIASAPIRFDEALLDTRYFPDDVTLLPDYLADSQRLWLMLGNSYPAGEVMLAAIEDEFSLYSAVTFRGETYYRGLEIREYRRQPHDAAPRLRFGEDIFLLAWRLNNDRIIAPCDSISVDTWWSVAQPLDKLYSSTLVIAAADGQGVINSDAVPGGIYPTPLWQPGQLYFDERELKLPCGLPAGDYPLLLGMYATPGAEGESPQNLLIHSADGAPSDRQLEYLTTLVVPP
ncbi:MAG: glycosyltransferase family 39 protein [Chloroflexi bacterium]|nr:glycosyltransferase family 39 protein [Chloroflexota bacterium]MXV93430.1 glycosyltransferase family 39 protein [Chloroflexota bacterium]MYA94144.1 glycosyltransferase family 39 protein [Chloroflexota bacterium]MYC55633.1 glycosyltransferase family 39 protein [Chloroflexota bacterium]MYH65657.1 glycosyltransferase family 39 protein [Chloroflexota bacterium]